MDKVLIIIPSYNEAGNIGKVINELREVVPQYDYIVVNDCSDDTTAQIVRECNGEILNLSINLGIGGAVQTGYLYALENNYNIAIQLDGDGQHDPKYIRDLIRPIESGMANICIGSRFVSKEGFQSSGSRRIGILFLSFVINLCTGKKIKDVTSGFRAVNREYIEIYADDYPQDYPEPEAIVTAYRSGATIKEVPVVMRAREKGTSSISAKKAIYYMIKVTLSLCLANMVGKKR